jgi:transcriptional regulator of acetoin/glycerol metabolism
MTEVIPTTNEELKQIKKEIRQKAVTLVEKNFIRNALAKAGWNITRAAELAGLQRTNFQKMMKKHGITLSERNKTT